MKKCFVYVLISFLFTACKEENQEPKLISKLSFEELQEIAQPYLDAQGTIDAATLEFEPYLKMDLDSALANYTFSYDSKKRFLEIAGTNNSRFFMTAIYDDQQVAYNYLDGADYHFLDENGLAIKSDLSTAAASGVKGILYNFYKDGFHILSMNDNGEIQILNEYNDKGNLVRRTNFTGNAFEDIMEYDYYEQYPNTINQEIHQFTLLNPKFRNPELGNYSSHLIRNIYFKSIEGLQTNTIEFKYEFDEEGRVQKMIAQREVFPRPNNFVFSYE